MYIFVDISFRATPEHPTRSDEEARIPSSKTIYNRDAEREKIPGFSQQLTFQQKGIQKPIAPAMSPILPTGHLNTGVSKTLLESSSMSGNTLSIQALNTNVTSIAPPAAHTNVSLVSPGTTIAHNLSVTMASIIRQPPVGTPPAAHQGTTFAPHAQNRSITHPGNPTQKTLRQQTAIVPTVTKLGGQSVTIATGNALHAGGAAASTANNSVGTSNVHISIQQPTSFKTSSIHRFPATVTTISAPSGISKKVNLSSHIIKKRSHSVKSSWY